MLGVVGNSAQILGIGGPTVLHHSSGQECVYTQISYGFELGFFNLADLHDLIVA